MIELILFIIIGLVIGVLFGLVPGLHPNLIILMIPFFIALNLNPITMLAFIVTIAISNTLVDFIPSMLLGAPDAGTELAVLPAHKLLMKGYGYSAIKLTVIGAMGAILLCTVLLPLIIISIPTLFIIIRPYTYILLIFIVLVMILGEHGNKKILAVFCFLAAGAIGLMASSLPIDSNLALFPIFSGLFGASMLFLQIKKGTKLPKQHKKEFYVSRSTINRSVLLGTIGGIFSGLLPGVGSSEIASLASTDKNEKAFLVTMGSIASANILLSILSLWLISKPRSGVAVVINQLTVIGFNEFLLIVFVGILVCGISVIITLGIAKQFIKVVQKINYTLISKIILIALIALSIIFTGFYGLFLFFICTSLGIFTNLAKVRRGTLMGVLILPTILFYMPF